MSSPNLPPAPPSSPQIQCTPVTHQDAITEAQLDVIVAYLEELRDIALDIADRLGLTEEE